MKKLGSMGKRDEFVFFDDIIQCIDKISEYLNDVSEEQFKDNAEKQDAVIRRIEIIGEAVKSISNETRKQFPHIPWKEIRNERYSYT